MSRSLSRPARSPVPLRPWQSHGPKRAAVPRRVTGAVKQLPAKFEVDGPCGRDARGRSLPLPSTDQPSLLASNVPTQPRVQTVGTHDHTPAPLGASYPQLGNQMVLLSGWRKGGHEVVSICHFRVIASFLLLTPPPFAARLMGVAGGRLRPFLCKDPVDFGKSQWTLVGSQDFSSAGTAWRARDNKPFDPAAPAGAVIGGVSQ
jgi:hypothetical protein